MNDLSEYEQSQCRLIALYHPYPYSNVVKTYIDCNKSFDQTVKHLEYERTFNKSPEDHVAFCEWLDGCGFRFFHNTDRYGFYGHGHVFLASFQLDADEIENNIAGLEGCDADAETSWRYLTEKERDEQIYIGFDLDPLFALQKCLEKLRAMKNCLDYETNHE